MEKAKKLYRSKKNRMLAGVCGGMAEYFNMDPTVMRIIWVVASLLLAAVGGVIAYVICALLIPEAPGATDVPEEPQN